MDFENSNGHISPISDLKGKTVTLLICRIKYTLTKNLHPQFMISDFFFLVKLYCEIVGLFDAAGLFEDLKVSEGNMGTNQQFSSLLWPSESLAQEHRKFWSVCPKQERDTSVSYLLAEQGWRRQCRTAMKIGPFCILSAVFWTDKDMVEVCPFSLSSSSVMLDRDGQQRDTSSSDSPESRQGAKLEHNHTDANTDWFYQFTYCS